MRRRLSLLTMVLIAVPFGASAQQSTPPGSFTPAQRAEIVAILRQALKSDPSILRDAVVSLQQDQQSQAVAASTRAVSANHDAIFADPADQIAGNRIGRLTLVEFFDVRCPYCRRMKPMLEAALRANPALRLVLKDLPVLGPASVLGAKAMLAAVPQGGYFKLQDALMREGAEVSAASIERAAMAAGLDWPAIRRGMESPAVAAHIAANTALAGALGIDGTPAFVVGNQLVPGAMSPDELNTAIAALGR